MRLLEQQCRDIAEAVGIRGCVNMEFIEADQGCRASIISWNAIRGLRAAWHFPALQATIWRDAHIRCFTGEKLDRAVCDR